MSETEYFYNVKYETPYLIDVEKVTAEHVSAPALTEDMFKKLVDESGESTFSHRGSDKYRLYKVNAIKDAINKEGSLIKPDKITRNIKNPDLLEVLRIRSFYVLNFSVSGKRVIHTQRHRVRKRELEDINLNIRQKYKEKERSRLKKEELKTNSSVNRMSVKKFNNLINQALNVHNLELEYEWDTTLRKLNKHIPVYRKFISIKTLRELNKKHKLLPPKGMTAYAKFWSNQEYRNEILNKNQG